MERDEDDALVEVLLAQRKPKVLLETAEKDASLLDQRRLVRPAVDFHLVAAGLTPLLRDQARAQALVTKKHT